MPISREAFVSTYLQLGFQPARDVFVMQVPRAVTGFRTGNDEVVVLVNDFQDAITNLNCIQVRDNEPRGVERMAPVIRDCFDGFVEGWVVLMLV